jgi:hypothetical protein
LLSTGSLSENGVSPLCKGGLGGFSEVRQGKSPFIPLYQRGM